MSGDGGSHGRGPDPMIGAAVAEAKRRRKNAAVAPKRKSQLPGTVITIVLWLAALGTLAALLMR
jgi:hypothetical protein